MFHSLQTFSVDFLEVLLKRRHFNNNLNKSANKFVKENQYNDDKKIINSTIDFFPYLYRKMSS